MNGKYIYSTLFSLFFLLPCTSWAQGIVRCEYWFDGDIANKVENKMNGSETVNIVSRVPTAQLDDGFHQFNFRVMQSDGMYSPVLSRVFFKSAASSSSMLEYWFDDNFEKRASTELSAADAEGNVAMSLDLSDNAKFPMGNHRLHLRLTNSHGVSAVYTSSVLKLQSGKIELLEYWIDDEHSNVNYAYGKINDKNKEFLEPLDLSGVSEGVHRLYYRGVSVDGGSSTAISSTPIMVKNRQNFDPAQQKVVSYSVAVDKSEPKVFDMMNPGTEVEMSYTVDARNLKEGNHTVTAKAWNTSGTGTSQQKTFKVGKSVSRAIKLTAAVADGEVELSFNSIPNDVKYRVWRMGSDGSQRKVFDRPLPNYPNDMKAYNKAPVGVYTYVVHAFYTDVDGTQKDIKSNEVKVEFTKKDAETVKPEDPVKNVRKSTIYGRIDIDKKQTAVLPERMDVTFSDGVVVRAESNGIFLREGVPVETELTMTVKNCTSYIFDEPKVVVTENTANQVQIINATTRKDVTVQNNNAYYSLVINKAIEWRPYTFQLSVKNNSGGPWKGSIKMVAIEQKRDKEYLAQNISDIYTNREFYYELASTHVDFATQEIKPVELKIEDEDYPKIKENTSFNLYFLAEPDNAPDNARLLETLVNISENPKMQVLPPFAEHHHEELEDRWGSVEECVKAIFDEMKTLKKYGIPLAEEIEKNSPILQQFGKDLKEAIEAVDKTLKPMQKCFESVESLKSKLEAISNFNNATEFEKWNIVASKIIELSGSPFADVYKVYLDATVKTVQAINRVLNQWDPFDYARCFLSENKNEQYKFKIKVAKPKTWKSKLLGDDYFSGELVYDKLVGYQDSQYSFMNHSAKISIIMIVPINDQINDPSQCPRFEGEFTPVLTDDGEVILKGYVNGQNKNDAFGRMPKQFWMEVKWPNGRISKVPLMLKNIVSYDLDHKTITVSFRSGVDTAWNMDDIIYILPADKSLEDD